MGNWDGRLGVFDLETTGVDVDRARIVSACIAVLDGDGSVLSRWDWLADPGVEIPEGASAVHGITTEYAQAKGRSAEVVVGEITQTLRALFALGIPLVVYNAPYDLSLLDRECRRHHVEPIENPEPVVDPLVLDRVVERYRKGKRTLAVTAALYEVPLDDAHDAGADAIAAGRVAQAMIARYPDELDHSPADLHGRQEVWYVEQAENFEAYVREKRGDAEFSVGRDWPIRLPEHPGSLVDTQPLPRPIRVSNLPLALGSALPAPPAPVRDDDPRLAETVSMDAVDTAGLDADPFAGDEPVERPEPALREGVEPPLETTIIDLPADLSSVDLAQLPRPDETPLEGIEPPDDTVGDLDEAIAADDLDADEAVAEETEREPGEAEPGIEPDTASAGPAVLRIAAAIITDPDGRTLLVRKRGTDTFMQPGGKIERGESAWQTIVRELAEELDLVVDPDATEHLGSFPDTAAANEPDTIVRAVVFALVTDAMLEAHGEIEEIVWIDEPEPEGLKLAPLSVEHLLPLWQTRLGH